MSSLGEGGSKLEDILLTSQEDIHQYSNNTALVTATATEDLVPAIMPWFKKSKRKHKISKKDISEPTEFKHCYHAVVELGSRELAGLPPQWSELVEPPAGKKLLPSGKVHCPDSPHSSAIDGGAAKEREVCSPLAEFTGSLYNFGKPEGTPERMSSTRAVSAELNGSGVVSMKDYVARNLSSSSKHSLASTNSTLSLTKRPSPIVRDSDASLEDTIKCIRKQSQHRSNESFQEEHLVHPVVDKEGGGRARMHTRSRTGSFMQLRSSPINRKHVASYTSGTTSMTPHPSDRLPPSSFCLSAPSEVVQSDLGLYNASESESSFSHCRINSPNGSSGYFGSSGSSLCSSRMSSMQQLHSQPQAHSHTPALRSNSREPDSHEFCSGTSNNYPSHFTTHHHHHHHHRFSSLQRRVDVSNSGSGTGQHAHNYRPSASENGVGMMRSGGVGHYGTAPRALRSHLSSQGGRQYPNVEMDRIQEQRRKQLFQEQRSHPLNQYPHSLSSKVGDVNVTRWSSNESTGWSAPRKELRHHSTSNNGNCDRFRATLELLVNPGDPRNKYVDFVKIGTGSTGHVYMARDVATGQVVAVKKMNLWKQQRKELLFNEVNNFIVLKSCHYVIVYLHALRLFFTPIVLM